MSFLTKRLAAFSRTTERLGRTTQSTVLSLADVMAVIWSAVGLAISPFRSSWSRCVRVVLARQILFTAVDAMFVSLRIGGAVGILMIVQTALWIDAFGGSAESIAPMLLRATVRELAPLIACLIVIGRSGSAMATELATMRVNGELDVLEAQGIDPMTYLVMPRIVSVTISVFSLAILVAVSMFTSGYIVGVLMEVILYGPLPFFYMALRELNLIDLIFFCSKTIIAGMFVGAICCVEGLKIRGASTDVPRVASASGVRALTAVFFVSAVLSLLIYGRILVFQVV